MRFIICMCLVTVCHTAVSETFEVVRDRSVTEYSLSDYPRLSDLDSLFSPKDAVRDQIVWLRPSHVAAQNILREGCIGEIQSHRVPLTFPDFLRSGQGDTKGQLIDMLKDLEPSGRIVEYGSLDPIDIEAKDWLNRKIRAGDQFVWQSSTGVVLTWDYQHAWRERAHSPTHPAWRYAIDGLASGAIRGDWSFVVEPSGRVRQVGIASYNRADWPVPPGSIIFYPPPGLGRGSHPIYQCIAQFLQTQYPKKITALPWWRRE